jgi:hypothetical protein
MPETPKETTNPYELLSLPDPELLLQKQQALQFLLKKINETELTDRQLSQMSGVAEDTVSQMLSGDIAVIAIEDINRVVSCFGAKNYSRILIPDNTPLSLLAMIGREALDWLFVPGAEVWITDVVKEEAMREPDGDGDGRELHRTELVEWFARNQDRIRIQKTDEGEEYRKAMEAWSRVPGMPAELKPSWRGRGERSVLQVLDSVEKFVAGGESGVAIVDDKKARAAIKALDHVDIDLMATETYLNWLIYRVHIKAAESALTLIGKARFE